MSQILDLMFYWSKSLDTHEYLRRHCYFTRESTIIDWKRATREICTLYFLKYPCVIHVGGPGHIVAIDESVWIKRKYNKGRQVNNQ